MDPLIANLLAIVTRTPWWVWPVLLLLVVAGWLRLKPRVSSLARLVLVPGVFLVWGLASLTVKLGSAPELALPWLGAALLGSVLGWSTAPTGIRADRERRRIYVPGRVAPLVASLVVFALKYAINVATAIRPDAGHTIAVFDMAVSGISAGYFSSGLVRTLLRYRLAPDLDLHDAPAPARP